MADRPVPVLENRLLAALPPDELTRLRPSFRTVRLKQRDVLNDPGVSMRDVYFPRRAVISIVSRMQDGSSVEVATIGNEGLVGVPVFLGTESMPLEVFVGIAGEAVAIRASVFRDATRNGGALRDLTQRYAQALFKQIAQAGACNRLHSIDQRFARWLLMSDDRLQGDEFPLTHELLAQMLAVRRATVSIAANILRRAGFIRYRRGRVRIVQRDGLERAACECYHAIRKGYERLIV